MTTYYESAKGQTITSARAIRELKRHSMGAEDVQRFLDETGHQGWYKAQDVLDWLGY